MSKKRKIITPNKDHGDGDCNAAAFLRKNKKIGRSFIENLPANATTHSSVQEKPILVVLPGASGNLSSEMNDIIIPELRNHFDVRIRLGKWKGWNPESVKNVESVLDACPSGGSDGQGKDWFILGNSFANRVLCAMSTNNLFISPPRGLIMCGYPMYGQRQTSERVKLLQELRLQKGCTVMCISGTKDEFLLRRAKTSEMSAAAVYESVMEEMSCKDRVSLRLLPGGRHGVLEGLKNNALEEAASLFLSWILNFTACTSDEM